MEGRIEIVIEKVFKIFKIEKVFKIIAQYFEGLRSPSASKYITCWCRFTLFQNLLNKLPNCETYFAHLLI